MLTQIKSSSHNRKSFKAVESYSQLEDLDIYCENNEEEDKNYDYKDYLTFELEHYEKFPDFVKIDSLSSLNTEIKQENRKMFVCGNEKILRVFFEGITNYKLTHLVIKTPNFSSIYRDKVIRIIKNGLNYLRIECDIIEDPKILVEDNFYFYSSLEVLEIVARGYEKLHFNSRDGNSQSSKNYLQIKPSIDEKCNEIIKLNREVTGFLSNVLPDFQKKLTELNILEENSFKVLNTQQIEFAVNVSKQYSHFIRLAKFYAALYQNSTFNIIQKLANGWDIKTAVREEDIEKFNKIKSLLPDFNINQRFSVLGNNFKRLIDIAAIDNKSVKMVKFLSSLNADLTCSYDSETILDNSSPDPLIVNVHRMNNFPFIEAIKSSKQELRKLFLTDENALYDGLAWLIYANDCDFENIASEIDIDVNKIIPQGLFTGFTLIQLMVYYQRTELFLKWLDKFSPEEIIVLANKLYPDRKSFPYAKWSLLAVIIYQGQYDEIDIISKKIALNQINLKSDKNCNPIKLLLYGAVNANQKKLSILKNYEKCLKCLVKSQMVDIDIQDLKFNDTENGELTLLHFSVYNNIFSVIKNYLTLLQNSLQQRIYIKEANGEVNPLELTAIIKSDKETVETLFDLYNTNRLLSTTNDLLSGLAGINLFQYSILSRNYYLFKKFIEWNECPINAYFPKDHPEYPGWLPIHVILLEEFVSSEKEKFLDVLLTRSDLNITEPFGDKGKPHDLVKYYPSSAIFFAGNPIKDSDLTPHMLSGYLDSFLPLMNNLDKLLKTTKRKILNQALYCALIHHNKKTGHDYSQSIMTLVDYKANPYQSYGSEGNLIIDLAREKGLLHLFPSYLEERIRSLSKQVDLKDVNMRKSELQQFANRDLYIHENSMSVVSLVRNKNSKNTQHAFIIIEQIIQGRSVMHFIDFVQDNEHIGKGKIRHKICRGKITASLICRCDDHSGMMKIKNVDDLSCVPPWPITNEACTKILDAVEMDENREKKINYVPVGDRSILPWLSSKSKKGHNCYTWAREKILMPDDPNVGKDLKPTFEEWLGTLPSLKDRSWRKNHCLLFSASATMAVMGLGLAMTAMNLYKNYNNDPSFNTTLNF